MDKLYIGDIPLNYKYAQFGSNYITLYSKSTGRNETLDFYRIYTNNNGFYYSVGSTTFGNTTTSFQEIDVTDNFLYRTDVADIFSVSFFCILLFVFLLNLVTSVFKKGGVLGGLL